MPLPRNLPDIETVLDKCSDTPGTMYYGSAIRSGLRKVIGSDTQLWRGFSSDEEKRGYKQKLLRSLPLVECFILDKAPYTISISLLSSFRLFSSTFFQTLISRHLIPGIPLNLDLVFSADFRLPILGNDLFSMNEVIIQTHSPEIASAIEMNLGRVKKELCMGIPSIHTAHRILESKGLSVTDKESVIQEKISYLIAAKPRLVDRSIFQTLQRYFVMGPHHTRLNGSLKEQLRLVLAFHFFRQDLRAKVRHFPSKRHIRLRVMRSSASRVALYLGLNLLQENESFKEKHLLRAALRVIPNLKVSSGTFYLSLGEEDWVQVMHVELTKQQGLPITNEEIRLLANRLPADIHHQIERLTSPIFMPRNEEEVMKSIIALSQEVSHPSDLPHLNLTFETSVDLYLYFTLVLVRGVSNENGCFTTLLNCPGDLTVSYTLDRVKMIKLPREGYEKEAAIFRVKVHSEQFARIDHSVNLQKARGAIVADITQKLGRVRDFNGGMFSKESEVFASLSASLLDNSLGSERDLEDFFYALQPAEMKATADPQVLKELLLVLQRSIVLFSQKNQKSGVFVNNHEEKIYTVVRISGRHLKSACEENLKKFSRELAKDPSGLIWSSVQYGDVEYLGIVNLEGCLHLQNELIGLLEGAFV